MNIVEKLKKGNEKFIYSLNTIGIIDCNKRIDTFKNGQHPFVLIICCSDSRVIPEAIFNLGIGEAFVIRSAGNSIGESELASIEYGVRHLHIKDVVVLGHTNCGAVGAAMHKEIESHIGYITKRIVEAIGSEQDYKMACIKNVHYSMKLINNSLGNDFNLIGALYDIETGKCSFDI